MKKQYWCYTGFLSLLLPVAVQAARSLEAPTAVVMPLLIAAIGVTVVSCVIYLVQFRGSKLIIAVYCLGAAAAVGGILAMQVIGRLATMALLLVGLGMMIYANHETLQEGSPR